jgi:hypothetical protein
MIYVTTLSGSHTLHTSSSSGRGTWRIQDSQSAASPRNSLEKRVEVKQSVRSSYRSNPPGPDLARIVAAWPELPEHIRGAILALVESAKPDKSGA